MMNNMIRLFSLLSLATLAGCTAYIGPYGPYGPSGEPYPLPPPVQDPTPPPPVPRVPVAHVSAINGSEAYVGSMRARVGQPVYLEDHFFTGAGTSMVVALDRGGTVTLEPNTDPSFLRTAQCFLIRVFSGSMTVNASNVCVEDKSNNKVVQHSRVLYVAERDAGRLTVTVFEGLVTTLRPRGIMINAGYTLILQRGEAIGRPTPTRVQIL